MSDHASSMNVARPGIGSSVPPLQGVPRLRWLAVLLFLPLAQSRMWSYAMLVAAWVVLIGALVYAIRRRP